MKWQAWKGFAVGLIASLGLIGGAGAGWARAAAEPEPSFVIPTEAGAALATVAPGPEPTFDLPAQAGEAFATVGTRLRTSESAASGKTLRRHPSPGS